MTASVTRGLISQHTEEKTSGSGSGSVLCKMRKKVLFDSSGKKKWGEIVDSDGDSGTLLLWLNHLKHSFKKIKDKSHRQLDAFKMSRGTKKQKKTGETN